MEIYLEFSQKTNSNLLLRYWSQTFENKTIVNYIKIEDMFLSTKSNHFLNFSDIDV